MESFLPTPEVGSHDLHLRSRAADRTDAVRACKIFIIDAEEPHVRLLERLLSRAGFRNLISTTDARELVALFTSFQPDLVLTDWVMPALEEGAVLKQLRALTAIDDFLPIVVLTADMSAQAKRRAVAAGATEFLTKPFDHVEVLLRIENLLKARLSHRTIRIQNARFEESVRGRTIELERALNDLRRTQRERLTALGVGADAVAHDLNNTLSLITGYGDLLLYDAEHGLPRENAVPAIATILTAAAEAGRIVQRLRELHRPREMEEQQAADLDVLIGKAIS